VDAGAPLPVVTHLSVRVDEAKRLMLPLDRNDDMARGYSQLLCYQPMFGYGLERLRHGALRPGPALAELPDGTLNLKNPACYLYPEANGCVPGEHPPRTARGGGALPRYQPFAFQRSAWQSAADAATLAALLLTLAALAVPRPRRRRRFSAGATPAPR
jgi:hypothetical protein